MQINISASRLALVLAPFCIAELNKILSEMLASLGYSNKYAWSLDLALVDDNEMELYNQRALGLAGPTNVLSFPALLEPAFLNFADADANIALDDAKQEARQIGEIVLSVDTLKRESFLYAQNEQEHMLWLLAHALAHLGDFKNIARGGLEHGAEHDFLSEKAFLAAKLYLENNRG